MKNSFKRKELKYRLTLSQRDQLLQALQPWIIPDVYSDYRLYSLYCDSPGLDLLRTSGCRPAYREKVRLRSYQENPEASEPVFLEVKKKIDGITVKTRKHLPLADVRLTPDAFTGPDLCSRDLKRIASRYALQPVLFLSYHRICQVWKDDPDLRITFDDDVLFRTDNLVLARDPFRDRHLLPEEECILEIKTTRNLPLVLVRTLERLNIRPASFSKAGKAFETMIQEGEFRYGTDNRHDFCLDGAGQPAGRKPGNWCSALLL